MKAMFYQAFMFDKKLCNWNVASGTITNSLFERSKCEHNTCLDCTLLSIIKKKTRNVTNWFMFLIFVGGVIFLSIAAFITRIYYRKKKKTDKIHASSIEDDSETTKYVILRRRK